MPLRDAYPLTSGQPGRLSRDQDDARNYVRDRLELSLRKYGGQNRTFRELNRYYLSLSPRVQTTARNDSDRRSAREPDLFVPRSFAAIESSKPGWLFGVFGGHPPIRVQARKDEYFGRVKGIQNTLTYDFDQARVLYKAYPIAASLFKYGTGVGQVGWKYDSYFLDRWVDRSVPAGITATGQIKWRTDRLKGEPEEIVRSDHPSLTWISVYNWFPDPFYYELDELRYCCVRRWTDRSTLKLENENYTNLMGKPKYVNLDDVPPIGRAYIEEAYDADSVDDLAEAMGWDATGGFRALMNSSKNKELDLVEVIELWDRNDKLIELANGHVPIRKGQNPYEDKELPFLLARCYPQEGSIFGLGQIHPIKRSQEEFNSLRNLNLKQAMFNIANAWGYDASTGLPKPITSIDPGDIVEIPFLANGNPGLVPLIPKTTLPPEAYQFEDRIDRDMQIALAKPGYQSGMGAGQADTATGAGIDERNMQDRIRLQNLFGSIDFASNLARLFISRRKQYMKEEGEAIRIAGPEGLQYMTITRQDLEGEYDFIPGGQHVYPGKDVLRQQHLNLVAIVGQNPVYQQMTNMYEFWSETFRMMDFERPDRFLNPPPEKNPFATHPELENKLLRYGEWLEPTPFENHEQHIQEHQKLLDELVESDSEDRDRIIQNVQQHQAIHNQLLQQQQAAQTPPQETPGMNGNQGNIPNLENAIPTQGRLSAQVNAGPGVQA